MKTKRIFSVIVCCVILASCNKDEGPFYPVVNSQADTNTVSYSKDVQPVFNSYCVACHTEQHAKLNLRSCCSYEQLLETGVSASYIDTVSPENSNLYKHLSGSLSMMPPSGKLTEAQIRIIKNWISQGGKNN